MANCSGVLEVFLRPSLYGLMVYGERKLPRHPRLFVAFLGILRVGCEVQLYLLWSTVLPVLS